MCVILVKPTGIKMPSREELKKCFDANPDGAGFMLPINGKVTIHKGFMNFNDFAKDLINTVKVNKIDPVKTPIICHFRISTQGGVRKQLCHPYPICRDYKEMGKLENTCDIAMAHNGVISLTSEPSYYGGHWDSKAKKWVKGTENRVSYNDTMTFIKKFASLIIDDDKDFDNNSDKCELLENIVGSSNKLAFMTGDGNIKLIGNFENKNGVLYSNLFFEYHTDNKFGFRYSKDYLKSDLLGHPVSPDDIDDKVVSHLPLYDDFDD